MATKQARGIKRTCQNPECGSRFYDLNKTPITCPICGSVYEIASAPMPALAAEVGDEKTRKIKKAEFVAEPDVAAEVPVPEGEDQLTEIEAEEPIAADEDETFLEEEDEEGGDMAKIIGPVAEDDEET